MIATDDLDPGARRRALTLLAVVVFFAVTAGNMVNVALPVLGDDFGVSEGTYGWVVTGYMLTFAVFGAIHGRLADRVGVRRLYLAGVGVFGVGSAAVGALQAIEWIIAVRVVQGAGAAAMPALGTLIIARLYPPQERGAASGVLLASVGAAASVGPFLGGALIQVFHWRAVFLFSAVALVAVPLGVRWLPRSLDVRGDARLDVLGAALLTAGASLLIYSFKLVEEGGLDRLTITTVALGLLALVGFALRIRSARAPFVDPEVFSDLRYTAVVAVAFLGQATRMGSVVLVPILLHEVEGLAPIWVGAVLLPGAVLVATLSHLAGRISDRVGARLPVVCGTACTVAGNLVVAASAGVSVAGVTAGMTLYGLGFAFIQSPLLGATSQILPDRHAGVGIGMFMTIFFLGGAFGIALSVTALELQGSSAASWIGLDLGAGAMFSNAALTLTGLALLGLACTAGVPGRAPAPRGA